MSSISSGFSELSREKFTSVPDCNELLVPRPPAEYRTPSTYQIGALLKLTDETPRIRIDGAPPSSVPGRSVTPGDLAMRRSERLWFGVSSTRFVTFPRVET